MKTTLKIVEDECWSCKKIVNLAFVLQISDGQKFGSIVGAEYFSDELITLSKKYGVIIEHRHSKTMDETYNANVCPHCNFIFGQMFTYKYVYSKVLHEIEIDNDLVKCSEQD